MGRSKEEEVLGKSKEEEETGGEREEGEGEKEPEERGEGGGFLGQSFSFDPEEDWEEEGDQEGGGERVLCK